jgi:hypothetical protein
MPNILLFEFYTTVLKELTLINHGFIIEATCDADVLKKREREKSCRAPYFVPAGPVRYCMIRLITSGFLGRLIWQYWSGAGRYSA